CDALYMPDPVLDEAVFDEISRTRGAEGFVKLLVLYDMFGLEDMAAALLVKLRENGFSHSGVDITASLDALVPENPYGASSHADYIAAFKADPRALFPSALRRMDASVETSAPAPAEGDCLPDLALGEGAARSGAWILVEAGESRYAIYGPYRPLRKGSYRATISILELASKGHKPGQPATVEIVLDEQVIESRAVTASASDISIPFGNEKIGALCQIRVLANRGAGFIVTSARVSAT
ncbi:MAG: hypothetical protein WBA25_05020, partial [Jannaschia sp.]